MADGRRLQIGNLTQQQISRFTALLLRSSGTQSNNLQQEHPAKAEIKNRVRRLRFEHGEMTQHELADRVGCTHHTIIGLEQGKYVPSLALAFRIARAFGLSVEDVFEYAE